MESPSGSWLCRFPLPWPLLLLPLVTRLSRAMSAGRSFAELIGRIRSSFRIRHLIHPSMPCPPPPAFESRPRSIVMNGSCDTDPAFPPCAYQSHPHKQECHLSNTIDQIPLDIHRTMSEPARLGVAVLGVGRMGRRHALNVSQTSAACSHAVSSGSYPTHIRRPLSLRLELDWSPYATRLKRAWNGPRRTFPRRPGKSIIIRSSPTEDSY